MNTELEKQLEALIGEIRNKEELLQGQGTIAQTRDRIAFKG